MLARCISVCVCVCERCWPGASVCVCVCERCWPGASLCVCVCERCWPGASLCVCVCESWRARASLCARVHERARRTSFHWDECVDELGKAGAGVLLLLVLHGCFGEREEGSAGGCHRPGVTPVDCSRCPGDSPCAGVAIVLLGEGLYPLPCCRGDA